MESTDLDMGEIFDDNDDDEDIGAIGALPDLPEATQTQNEEEENAEVLERLKNLSKGAAKKVVRKPQPKLDPTRLAGERGIPILPKIFKDVKFKGKGHEAQDLATIMRQMEHWAHRLFPKMPFDEVIERVDKLGSKNEVKTCIKKIRLDMPILDNDFIGSDREDEDVVRRGEEEAEKEEARAEDMWDELLREEEELTASQARPSTEPGARPSTEPGARPSTEPGKLADSMTDADNQDSMIGTPSAAKHIADTTAGFTPEQLERIEKNKQLAMERRLKKMGHFTPGSKMSLSPMHSQQASTKDLDTSSSPAKVNSKTSESSDIESMGDNKCEDGAVEGSSKIIKSVEKTDSSQAESNTENTQYDLEAGDADVNEDGASGSKDTCESNDRIMESEGIKSASAGVDNTDTLEEMETEMSEVLEKGPSQNITVQVTGQNAQNWHTGESGGTCSGIKFDSELDGKIDDEVKSENTREDDTVEEMVISEESGKGDVGKATENSSALNCTEMSEVIEKQNDVTIVLKEKPGNLNEVNKAQKNVAEPKQSELKDITLDSGRIIDEEITDKENLDSTNSLNNKKGKENVGKEQVDTVKKGGNSGDDNDQFDEELSEDKLMIALDS